MKFLTILLLLVATSCKANTKDTIVLSKENTLHLFDEVSDESVANLLLEAKKLDAELSDGQSINLVLYTPGGSVVAGQEIIENLSSLGRPVNTITLFAASMGFQIAQGLGTRYITKSGELMSHKAKGSFGVLEFGGKEPTQMTNRYNSWLQKIKEMDLVTVSRTKGKQTLPSYQNAYENELWITGQTAVDAGYADKVVKVKCDETMSGTKQKTVYFFGMPIYLTFSECPTITGVLTVEAKIRTNTNELLSYSEFKQRGGQFGSLCAALINNKNVLCASDASLSEEKIDQKIRDIKNSYIKRNVIYTIFN